MASTVLSFRKRDPTIISRPKFEQYIEQLCMYLHTKLGKDVTFNMSSKVQK